MEEDNFITNFISDLREWVKNNPLTEKDFIGIINKNVGAGIYNPMYGKKHTQETKNIIKQKATGRKKPEGWGERHAEKLRGRKHTTETKLKMGLKGEKNPMFGKKLTEEDKQKRRIKLGMKVVIKGVEYYSKREAAKLLNVSRPTIDSWVRNGQ